MEGKLDKVAYMIQKLFARDFVAVHLILATL